MCSVKPAIERVMPCAPFQRVVVPLAIARERGAVKRGAVPRPPAKRDCGVVSAGGGHGLMRPEEVAPGRQETRPPMMHWRRVYVWVEVLSCTPRLRYDRRKDHALSPIPDARYAHALMLHAGDHAVLAGFQEAAVLLVDVPRLHQREALALLMQDGLADAGTRRPARRDCS